MRTLKPRASAPASSSWPCFQVSACRLWRPIINQVPSLTLCFARHSVGCDPCFGSRTAMFEGRSLKSRSHCRSEVRVSPRASIAAVCWLFGKGSLEGARDAAGTAPEHLRRAQASSRALAHTIRNAPRCPRHSVSSPPLSNSPLRSQTCTPPPVTSNPFRRPHKKTRPLP